MARAVWLIIVGVNLSVAITFAGVGEWKTYTAKREIRDLAFDKGTVWGATSGGLFSYRIGDSTFTEFSTSEGLRTINLTAVAVDERGSVWAGADDGFLHRYDPSSKQWSYISDIFLRQDPQKRINALVAIGDTLFILSDIGVSVFSISRMEFGDTYTRFGSLPNQIVGEVTALCIFNGNLWIGTRSGVASTPLSNRNPSAPESWQLFTSVQGVSSSPGVTGLVAANDSLYVSTSTGLAVFNGTSFSIVQGTAGLNIVDVVSTQAIYFITQTALWNYAGSTVTMIANGFPSGLTSIATNLILGSSTNGLIIQVTSSWVSKVPPGPPSNKFIGIAVDKRGVVWSGTGAASGEGFMSFDGTVWKSYTVEQDPRLGNDNYYKVSIGKDNSKWISNWGVGVALLDDRGILRKVLSTANGLPPTPNSQNNTNFVVVGGIVTDPDGVTWITNRTAADSTAAVLFLPDSTLSYKVKLKMVDPLNVFTDVVIDFNGTKWFANFSRFEPVPPAGFFFYNEHLTLPGTGIDGLPAGWGKLTTSDGLTSDNVRSIAIDRDGALWVGSDQGISIICDPRIPQSSLAECYQVCVTTVCDHPHPLRDQIIQAIVVDPVNNKWIGTKEGVFVLSSDGASILGQYTVKNTDGKLLDDDVASMSINANTGTIYFGTEKGLSSLTTFSVTPNRSFDELSVTPNPFYLPSKTQLTVDGLVENSTLKILSIDGSLVKEISTPGGRVGVWDGTDEQGHLVATAVYLVVAYSEDGSKVATGKVAVIRR